MPAFDSIALYSLRVTRAPDCFALGFPLGNGKLKKAVERTVGGPVTFLLSAPVVETFQGKTIWCGIVDVFTVNSPPPAKAYGWSVEGGKG